MNAEGLRRLPPLALSQTRSRLEMSSSHCSGISMALEMPSMLIGIPIPTVRQVHLHLCFTPVSFLVSRSQTHIRNSTLPSSQRLFNAQLSSVSCFSCRSLHSASTLSGRLIESQPSFAIRSISYAATSRSAPVPSPATSQTAAAQFSPPHSINRIHRLQSRHLHQPIQRAPAIISSTSASSFSFSSSSCSSSSSSSLPSSTVCSLSSSSLLPSHSRFYSSRSRPRSRSRRSRRVSVQEDQNIMLRNMGIHGKSALKQAQKHPPSGIRLREEYDDDDDEDESNENGNDMEFEFEIEEGDENEDDDDNDMEEGMAMMHMAALMEAASKGRLDKKTKRMLEDMQKEAAMEAAIEDALFDEDESEGDDEDEIHVYEDDSENEDDEDDDDDKEENNGRYRPDPNSTVFDAHFTSATPNSGEQVGQLVGGVKMKLGSMDELDERDLIEHFTRGGGKGGQAVNKTNNCVDLLHTPTGTRVKCHATRSLQQNRKIARQIMKNRLQELFMGPKSRLGQKKAKIKKQKDRNRRRREKKYGQGKEEDEDEDEDEDENEDEEIVHQALNQVKEAEVVSRRVQKQQIVTATATVGSTTAATLAMSASTIVTDADVTSKREKASFVRPVSPTASSSSSSSTQRHRQLQGMTEDVEVHQEDEETDQDEDEYYGPNYVRTKGKVSEDVKKRRMMPIKPRNIAKAQREAEEAKAKKHEIHMPKRIRYGLMKNDKGSVEVQSPVQEPTTGTGGV